MTHLRFTRKENLRRFQKSPQQLMLTLRVDIVSVQLIIMPLCADQSDMLLELRVHALDAGGWSPRRSVHGPLHRAVFRDGDACAEREQCAMVVQHSENSDRPRVVTESACNQLRFCESLSTKAHGQGLWRFHSSVNCGLRGCLPLL